MTSKNVKRSTTPNPALSTEYVGGSAEFMEQEKALAKPRINHKVEQVVRAVLIGFLPGDVRIPKDMKSSILQVDCATVPLICQFKPDEFVVIGKADARGYRFNPESNSALIWLGIHPTAFLFHLTKCVRDGVPCVRELNNGSLAIEFGALVQCARDAVFNWDTKESIGGKVQRRKPLLEAYILSGKPVKFA